MIILILLLLWTTPLFAQCEKDVVKLDICERSVPYFPRLDPLPPVKQFSVGFELTQTFYDWFGKAKIGDSHEVQFPSGDGCNWCWMKVYKRSETEINIGGVSQCTLRMCSRDEVIKVK